MAAYTRIDELLEACGVIADEGARQQHVEQTKEQIIHDIVEQDNLRLLLQGMDQKFRDSGREPPNWCRLFAGGCGTWDEVESCPIRLRDLHDLVPYTRDRQVGICKRFDLDTVTLISTRLDVLKSIRLVFKRDYLGAFRAEKDDLKRGRMYIPGLERQGQLPKVLFKVKGLPHDQIALRTGYATKRFIGYPRGHLENKTFVGQMYCNLGSDHEKWAAWECCYSFMAACLRGGWGASPDIVAPRSSSLCIPNPYKGEKMRTWMAGIAVSSREDCTDFMDLILKREVQIEYFHAEFEKAVEIVLNGRQRYLQRVQQRQNNGDDDPEENEDGGEEMDEDHAENEDGSGGDYDDGDVVDVAYDAGQAIEEGREGDGDLLFDAGVCLGHFVGMMQNLYFVTTIQLGRHGCGTISEAFHSELPGQRPPGHAEYREIGYNIMNLIEQYVCLERSAECPTLLAPNVGMEVTVQTLGPEGLHAGPSKRQFKVRSPLFEKDQGVRLHLDRRKFRDKPQEWGRRLGLLPGVGAAHEFRWYDSWGNMSKTDGPVSFKAKLSDRSILDEERELDALLELLLPIQGQFGVQAPILCIYECTYRATSPYSIFKNEKQLLESYVTLSSRASTRGKHRKALEHVCNAMREEVESYLLRLPSDAPIRFETVFPFDNGGADAPPLDMICGEKIATLDLIHLEGILGYSLNEEYPTLMKMLLPWVDIAEYQARRMLEEQQCVSPVILDSLALVHGQLSYQMSTYTEMDDDSRPFTRHLMRRPGLALRKSMEMNGFARVPDAILQGGVSQYKDASSQTWQLVATTAHSFVGSVLLGRLIKENYSLYRSFHFRRYMSLCCSEVFDVAYPSSFPWLMCEYLATAFLEYLVTKLHFKLLLNLGDESDPFGSYTIRRLQYRNQRGQDEDWLFNYDGDRFQAGCASLVFDTRMLDGVLRKVEVEAVLSPENVEYTAANQILAYDNRDGLSEALLSDVQRRATNRVRSDQTLYMEAFRGMMYKVDNMMARRDLVNHRSVLIQETLMSCVQLAQLRAWPQLCRMGGEDREKLKVWRLGPREVEEGGQWRNYFQNLDMEYIASMKRRVSNQDVIELGAFENMAMDLDKLASAWQTRQIANHFFSLSKRYPTRVEIMTLI